MIGKGTLSAGHAKAILTLDDQASMEKLAESVVKQGLSVRDAEARVILLSAPPPRGTDQR